MLNELADKFFPERVNRVLYSYSQDFDYLLLNNVKLNLPNDVQVSCSHLLITDKFIYCILDRYFEHDIKGNIKDKKWILSNKDGSNKRTVNNPIYLNRFYSYHLNMYFTNENVSEFLVVPLTVVNNRTKIPSWISEDSNAVNEICNLKNLKKFITNYEKTKKVGKLNPDDLELLVEFIKTFNGGMKKRRKSISKEAEKEEN